MALTFRLLTRHCVYFCNITKPVRLTVQINSQLRFLGNGLCCQSNVYKQLIGARRLSLTPEYCKQCPPLDQPPQQKAPEEEPTTKKGLMKKLKEMYRDYWYVVLPVHLFTSTIWFGSFYYAVRSGVDVVAILQSLGVSEKLITPLKESSAGYFALALALYKVATPLRYAVTIGGTTYAIKKLTSIGWIKPVPSRERIKEMLQEKKDNLQDRFKESKHHYQTQMQEKKTQVLDEMRRYKSEIRNIKDKVKKT